MSNLADGLFAAVLGRRFARHARVDHATRDYVAIERMQRAAEAALQPAETDQEYQARQAKEKEDQERMAAALGYF